MSELKKELTSSEVNAVVKRIDELKTSREELAAKSVELDEHRKDLAALEKIYGVGTKESEVKLQLIDLTTKAVDELQKKVSDLEFKKSELKPVLDQLAKDFEEALRVEQEKEYHIEISPNSEKPEERGNGKKIFKQLLDYLYHNVTFTPKTAANLMVLVRNMEENKAWVNSKEFDNTIILRSASVLSLWRFIVEDMSGKGFYEARTFLECWANCGQSVSETVRLIQKEHETSRILGTNLNKVEEEFDRSEDDLPHDESKPTTQEEVAPEIED